MGLTRETGLPSFRPEFQLTAEGRDITAAIAGGLVDITLTDYGGGTGKTDELQVTLLSETLRLPPKGAQLRLSLGFNGHFVDKGIFVVCGVGSSGPPRQIVIYATAAPMDGRKHAGNVANHKTRSFDGLTLGDIVHTLAAEHGLTARVSSSLADLKLGHIDQVRESDAALLSRLARQYNAVSKVAQGYWLFLVRGEGVSAGGKVPPVFTLTPAVVSHWDYSSGDRGASGAGKDKKGTVSVDYFHEQTGETHTVTHPHDGADQHHPYTMSSETEARHKAGAIVSETRQNERQMSLSLPCRPEHLVLSAEGHIRTQGFGTEEDREWLAESLKFRLSAQGLTLDVALVTKFDKKGASGKEKTSGASLDYFRKDK